MTLTAAHHMDRMYRNQRRIYDATRAYYLIGRDQMLRGLQARPGDVGFHARTGGARLLSRSGTHDDPTSSPGRALMAGPLQRRARSGRWP